MKSLLALSRTKKRLVLRLVLWILWLAVLLLSLRNANRFGTIYPAISLRYNDKISVEAANQARLYAAENAEDAPYWLTYWTEQTEPVSSELFDSVSRCVWYSGDATLVWPVEITDGSLPGELDEAGSVVSSGLAWQLWGSLDVVGNSLRISDMEYKVTGVFTDTENLVLASVGESGYSGGWNGVVISGDTRKAAEDFAVASGLGMPDAIVNGREIQALAGFLAWLPVVAMIIVALSLLMVWVARNTPIKGWTIALTVFLILAALSPFLLNALPDHFLPSRFSDFEFWGRLAKQQTGYANGYMLMQPYTIDLLAKWQMIKQVVFLFAMVLLSELVFRAGFERQRML